MAVILRYWRVLCLHQQTAVPSISVHDVVVHVLYACVPLGCAVSYYFAGCRWRGSNSNNFFLYADHKGLGMGGGGHGYAFHVDAAIKFGSSHKSETFGNFGLTDETEFMCVNLEVWGFEMPKRRRNLYS